MKAELMRLQRGEEWEEDYSDLASDDLADEEGEQLLLGARHTARYDASEAAYLDYLRFYKQSLRGKN